MDEARTRLAAMMGVARQEVSFGPSTTANTYVLAQAVRRWLKPGEAIVVTNQDHEANSGPWRRLAEEGHEVREWQIDPETGHLDPARLKALLQDGKVRLVCFPHCSNVVAEINPVAEIVKIAHEAGAATCVDGVSYLRRLAKNCRPRLEYRRCRAEGFSCGLVAHLCQLGGEI